MEKLTTKLEQFFASKWRSRLFGLSIIFLVLFTLFSAFRTPGHIVFGDLDFGFVLQGYIDRIFPLWNPIWSTATFFNGTRLPLVWILYSITSLVSDNPSLFEKSVIFSLLFLSGAGMFLFVSELLRLDRENGRLSIPFSFIFLIALGSALYYAFNPWSIIRIQHIYLLVWYAFLPFIFYEVLYLTENIRAPSERGPGFLGGLRNIFWIDPIVLRHIVFASLLYVFAVGAVHYLFFVFFFIGSWYFYRSLAFMFAREWGKLWRMTYYFILFGFFFLLLLSYWLLPYFGASLVGSVNPPSVNTIDSIWNLARYSTFRHVLYLTSYWWPMMDIENLPLSFWLGGGCIISIVFFGNIVNRRNKFVVYFFLWSLLLIILSTGTKIEYLAHIYQWIVFDNPVAGKMGFIFRDSNKLVGLLSFAFAVLWWTGLAGSLHFLLQRRKNRSEEIGIITRFQYVLDGKKRLFQLNGYTVLFLGFIFLTIASYTFYIRPFYQAFLQHFYLPVPVPSEYSQLIEYERRDMEHPDAKYLYLPRYESIVSPGYQFGVTTWNHSTGAERPTSSLDLYSSVRDTYNPLEGATTYLGHFYEYIDYYLTNNIGTNLAKYLVPLGIDKVVYHSDIVWLESYQTTQIGALEWQDDMRLEKEFGFLSVFSLDRFRSYFTFFPHTTFLFSGISGLETLFGSKTTDYTSNATVFVSQDPLINDWRTLGKKGDRFLLSDRLDLFLCTLKKDDFYAPFDSNNYSDAFSRWAKLREDIPDWKFHLRKLGIVNWPWDFSLNRWFIFTYAPAMLDLEPYEFIHDKGKDILDFKKALDISDLFAPSDVNRIQLVLEKTDRYAEIPAIKGEIIDGKSENWRAGTMKPIPAKERTAYAFEVVVSGKWVQNIHGKVKFLDVWGKEIGVDYVSAPRYAETFNLIKFSGNFITPIATKQIVFILNSQEKTDAKTYWWIHDIKIKDLSDYTKPNIAKWRHEFKEPGIYKIFTRSFHNIHGGAVGIRVGSYSGSIDTKTDHVNRFEWREWGIISIDAPGSRPVEIENIEGFNALNVIAFMRMEDYEALEQSTRSGTLIPGTQTIALEAENDFGFSGNIVSELHFPILSNGRSINLRDGSLEVGFDILKESDYSLTLRMNPDHLAQNYKAKLNIRRDIDGKEIPVDKLRKESDRMTIDSFHLVPGHYSLMLHLADKNIKKVNHAQMRRLDTVRDNLPEGKRDISLKDEPGCSYSAGLYSDSVWYKTIQGVRKVGLWPGFSCFWLITTHDMVNAKENDEYLIKSVISGLYTKNLHSKIRFLNAKKETIDTVPLDSYELEREGIDIEKQRIIVTPSGTAYMQVQFWQKQRQDKGSLLSIKDMFIERYQSLPGLDSMNIDDIHSTTDEHLIGSPDYSKNGSMSRQVSLANLSGGILQMHESFSPLWQWRTQMGDLLKPISTSLFLNGYLIPVGAGSLDFELAPKKFLVIGVIISLTALSLLCIFLGLAEIPRIYRVLYPKK